MNVIQFGILLDLARENVTRVHRLLSGIVHSTTLITGPDRAHFVLQLFVV